MVTVRAHGYFVPFALPLEDDGYVCVMKYLLSLRLNIWIDTMFAKHEMYFVDGNILEMILM